MLHGTFTLITVTITSSVSVRPTDSKYNGLKWKKNPNKQKQKMLHILQVWTQLRGSTLNCSFLPELVTNLVHKLKTIRHAIRSFVSCAVKELEYIKTITLQFSIDKFSVGNLLVCNSWSWAMATNNLNKFSYLVVLQTRLRCAQINFSYKNPCALNCSCMELKSVF